MTEFEMNTNNLPDLYKIESLVRQTWPETPGLNIFLPPADDQAVFLVKAVRRM